MNELIQIQSLMSNPSFQSFLISLGAGITWDCVKSWVLAKQKQDTIEFETYKVFADTFAEFYSEKQYDFDENIVMSAFIEQIGDNQTIDNIELTKQIISNTVGKPLDTIEYQEWVHCFIRVCSMDKYQRVYRMLVLNPLFIDGQNRDFSWQDEYMKGNYCRIKYDLHEDIIPLSGDVKTEIPDDIWKEIKMVIWEISFNAQKHGHATDCRIYIDEKSISIYDNGLQFNPLSLMEEEHYGGGSMAVRYLLNICPEIPISYKYEDSQNVVTIEYEDNVFNVNQLSEIIVPRLIYERKIELLHPNSEFKLYFIDMGRTLSENPYGISFSAIAYFLSGIEEKIDLTDGNKCIYIYFPDSQNKDKESFVQKIQICLDNAPKGIKEFLKESFVFIP